jgi:hypothetical protein
MHVNLKWFFLLQSAISLLYVLCTVLIFVVSAYVNSVPRTILLTHFTAGADRRRYSKSCITVRSAPVITFDVRLNSRQGRFHRKKQFRPQVNLRSGSSHLGRSRYHSYVVITRLSDRWYVSHISEHFRVNQFFLLSKAWQWSSTSFYIIFIVYNLLPISSIKLSIVYGIIVAGSNIAVFVIQNKENLSEVSNMVIYSEKIRKMRLKHLKNDLIFS